MQLTILFPAPDRVELAAGDGVGEGVVGLHIFVGGNGFGPLGQNPGGLEFFNAVGILVFLQASWNFHVATINNAVALVYVFVGKESSTQMVKTCIVYWFTLVFWYRFDKTVETVVDFGIGCFAPQSEKQVVGSFVS